MPVSWNFDMFRSVGKPANSLAMKVLSVAVSCCASVAMAGESPFATDVWEFSPAPGQFVNTPDFNDPVRALGAPAGGGTGVADLTSLVSLGGFGGRIVLGFDHTILDHPQNPMGLDAIVYGNAIWVANDPERHLAECATIEIALDENGNGLPDDPWYLIPGSHIPDPPSQFLVQTWDDNIGDPTFPPNTASWIPPGQSGTWTTEGYLLPPDVFAPPLQVVENPLAGSGNEGIYGYAEYAPTLVLGDLDADNAVDDEDLTAEAFYVVPDDPSTTGITPGAGGGDAFDIAWAIDPQSGAPANLPGFDFIRITTAVNAVQGPLGEVSTEIDAVADVAPLGGDLPTMSQWGIAAMSFQLAIVATLLFRRIQECHPKVWTEVRPMDV